MTRVVIDTTFAAASTGQPFRIFPKISIDSRGSFAEQWSCGESWPTEAAFMASMSWVKQINRSTSKAGVVRGLHAQSGKFCQGKLVEAVLGQVYDVIVDARPDSETFGAAAAYLLDSEMQTKLWVPRGFLHSFVVPLDCSMAVFQYSVDAPYCRASEIGCSPVELLTQLAQIQDSGFSARLRAAISAMAADPSAALSPKDMAATPYSKFMADVQSSGRLWWT